ncbi:hypothetical protein [Streptosporangium sp. CA-115845]|uniref:hypothetical protein n=1 Tax=Streptosporangium sp. CA-115845 TaxID=3240071 RepID=UPI003D90CE7A
MPVPPPGRPGKWEPQARQCPRSTRELHLVDGEVLRTEHSERSPDPDPAERTIGDLLTAAAALALSPATPSAYSAVIRENPVTVRGRGSLPFHALAGTGRGRSPR